MATKTVEHPGSPGKEAGDGAGAGIRQECPKSPCAIDYSGKLSEVGAYACYEIEAIVNMLLREAAVAAPTFDILLPPTLRRVRALSLVLLSVSDGDGDDVGILSHLHEVVFGEPLEEARHEG